MITREQFIELSGLLFTAQSHNLSSFKFEDNLITCDIAITVLDEYRKQNLPITDTGMIPNRIANQIKI
jgi:hypothetical protein